MYPSPSSAKLARSVSSARLLKSTLICAASTAEITVTARDQLPTTEEGWRKILSPEAYRITREKGTEAPFTGEYHDEKSKGTYLCAGCGLELFSSDSKFDSGTGWPSFYQPVEADAVEEHVDKSLFMKRTEVVCSRCGGHFGHVFPDGPQPTGMRYCMNSVSLKLKKKE